MSNHKQKKIKLVHPPKNIKKSNINSNPSSKYDAGTKPTSDLHHKSLQDKVAVETELLSSL